MLCSSSCCCGYLLCLQHSSTVLIHIHESVLAQHLETRTPCFLPLLDHDATFKILESHWSIPSKNCIGFDRIRTCSHYISRRSKTLKVLKTI
ncbi:hypothetical protein C0J52_24669 [Blattella germanica]|nr:hypothetical protein C0J52_24669 [Blattella germanica]